MIEYEIVERLDGLFDVVCEGEIVREAIFMGEAYMYSNARTGPGYITIVLEGTIRLTV